MSNGGLSPESSTIIDVVVDASVAVKWFVPENNALQTGPFSDDVVWVTNPI